MSHPWEHAKSSVRIFGGKAEDYIALHSWFDDTKAWCPDWRHRAIRHHTKGIERCLEVFGQHILNHDGTYVSVYDLGVQHVTEDVGFVPTPRDWMEHFDEKSWEDFCNQKLSSRFKLHASMTSPTPASVRSFVSSNQ